MTMALMSATGTEKGWDQPLEAGAASWLVPASGLGEEALGSVPMKLGRLDAGWLGERVVERGLGLLPPLWALPMTTAW